MDPRVPDSSDADDFSDVAPAFSADELSWSEPDAEPQEPAHTTAFTFTGDGGEYFRIWVINLLLMLVTLGLYSAWAKVRKAKYFRNNTQLDGHVFDYHGNPRAILRGRIVALILFATYSWAFDFSKPVGIAAMVVLCAAAPWLVMRGQQFTLTNTSFRGLRFGFRAHVGEAYRTVLPVAVLWLAPSLVGAFTFDGTLFLLSALALPVGMPWMHHRLKAYQHRNATYGDRCFSFTHALGRFYFTYIVAFGLMAIAIIVLAVLMFAWGATGDESGFAFWLLAGVAAILIYVLATPYLTGRLQQTIWNRTRLEVIGFMTHIRVWPLFRLVWTNVILTLATCGLYWPWAVVAMARYRIECLQLDAAIPLSKIVAGTESGNVSATGDGAADAFGFDIGI